MQGKAPAGHGLSRRGRAVAVQVVLGVSVARPLATAPTAASGPTPQSLLLLGGKGAAAISLPIEQHVLRLQHQLLRECLGWADSPAGPQ